ncbi:MAG: hypothetical protein H7210_14325 [Pyrinomonadaceae bacterium]|nr:hypothetical protein [Phycisphaerales bacterium]
MSFGVWAKSNWLILVLSGVSVAALPTAFYFSSKMHKDLIKTQQDKANKDLSEIATYKVTYTLPSVKEPELKSFEFPGPLNQKLIDVIQVERNKIKAESSKVGSVAFKFNEGEGERLHKPAMDGIFPTFADPMRKTNLQLAMVREFSTNIYPALITRVKAGAPPDPQRLSAELAESHGNKKRLMLSSSGSQTLTPEQDAELSKQLLLERMNSYRRQASKLSFYADPKNISEVPATGQTLPTLASFWDWQVKYWIHDDILSAIALANATRTTGAPDGVAGSVVKRVVKMSVEPSSFVEVPDELSPIDENYVQPTSKEPVTLNPSVSVTGRTNAPDNQFYDLRKVTLEIVVAPQRLPAFFDALAKTNFMTVLQCELDEQPIEDDIKEGFFYGDEHVVKAKLVIETLWLRAWTTKYMPDSVKRTLGVLEVKPETAEGAAEPPQ